MNIEISVKKKRGGCLKLFLEVVGVILGLVAVAIGGWSCRIHGQREHLRARLDTMIADWEAKHPPLAEEDNAAEMYEQAAVRLRGDIDRKALDASFRFAGQKTPPEVLAMLENAKPALELFEKGIVRESCRFTHGSFEDLFMAEPRRMDVFQLINLAALVGARGRKKAFGGDAQGAFEDVLKQLRLAEHLAQQGGAIDRMFATAVQDRTLENFQSLVVAGAFDDKRCLQAISEIDTHMKRMTEPAETLRGEKVALMNVAFNVACGDRSHAELVQKGQRGASERSLFEAMGFYWRWSGAAYKDTLHMEKGFDRVIAGLDKPPKERLAELDAIRGEIKAFAYGRRVGGDRFLYGITMPSMTLVAQTLREGESKMAVSHAGLSCCLYRLRKGKYPDSLEEVSGIKDDPHSTEPLRYMLKNDGFKVWATGADYEDGKGEKPMDDVFEVGSKSSP